MYNVGRVSLFRIPTEIRYGIGVVKTIGETVKSFNTNKALVVTDQGVVKSGLLKNIEESLKNLDIEYTIFDSVEANPSIETVEAGLEAYKSMEAGVVIAVGGGSPLDAGKAIGVLVTNGGSVNDYEGVDKVKTPSAPVTVLRILN